MADSPPDSDDLDADGASRAGWSAEGYGFIEADAALNWQPKASSPKGEDETLQGAAILGGESPSRIVERLQSGDPLGLGGKCSARIDTRAVLMDVERLVARAEAYVAYVAVREQYKGTPPLDSFLGKQIDEAIDSILEEDWASEHRNETVEPGDPRYRMIAREAGITPAQARRASLALNSEPLRARRLFYGVFVKNRKLAEVARENALGVKEAKIMIKATLQKVLGTAKWGGDE